MPSSDECIQAKLEIKNWALQQLLREGHPAHSAEVILQHMHYEQQVVKAELYRGPIYRGAYSPY